MRSRKLMVLGAGLCQVPIMRKAQSMGFEVIAISIPGDYPGFEVADRSYRVDVREKEDILAIARREGICGILTDQSDIPVPSVAYVAEKMGLPGIDYECAIRFTNKQRMRQMCEKLGVPIGRYRVADTPGQAERCAKSLGYPLVVKPVDSQGSRGVAKAGGPEELSLRFREARSHSASGRVVLEEYFAGNEFGVHGFVDESGTTILVVCARKNFDLPGRFLSREAEFPTRLADPIQRKLMDLDTRLIEGFGPSLGITSSEYLVDEGTGEVRLCETTIRGAGNFVSSHHVPLSTGIDVNERLIRLVTGEEVPPITPGEIQHRASGYVCFYLPAGIIRRVAGINEVMSIPGVHMASWHGLEPGRRTRPMTDKTARLGPILYAGRDQERFKEIRRRIGETLVVEVETPRGIEGIRWH